MGTAWLEVLWTGTPRSAEELRKYARLQRFTANSAIGVAAATAGLAMLPPVSAASLALALAMVRAATFTVVHSRANVRRARQAFDDGSA
jgi:hypothetical protein